MMKPLLAPVLLATTLLAGCHAPLETDTIILAFTLHDNIDPDADPERLAEWIAAQTGLPVEIYPITSEGAAAQALRFGHAHAAFMDGGAAWLAWQEFDLKAIAADQLADGGTAYDAVAWVRADAGIATFEDLRGRDSCHTGRLKSAGVLMPMGYLIGHGIAEVVGDPNDIASLDATVEAFFGDARMPEAGDPYYNYEGALRCMSEGVGEVAFIRASTYDDFCTGDAARTWCLPRDQLTTLPPFGPVPSHPVMVGPELDDETHASLRDALLALNDSDEGRAILDDVLNTPGITAVTTEGHLGAYSEVVRHVPGLSEYFRGEFGFEA